MLRLTRWTMAHRRLVAVGWVVAAIAILAISSSVGTRKANSFSLPNTGSQRALDLLTSHFPAQAGDSDQIVFHARAGTLRDPAIHGTVTAAVDRVSKLPHVTAVASPYSAGSRAISPSGTIGFATVTFDKRANELPKAAIQRVIDSAQSVRSPALQVELGGQAIEQAQQAGLGFATAVGIAAAIVILLISFGSVLAMGSSRSAPRSRARHDVASGGILRGVRMSDESIATRIETLVAEEHELRGREESDSTNAGRALPAVVPGAPARLATLGACRISSPSAASPR
jgi:uncharacterized membrane protein YdfJ with MMPL/SSD domain